MSALFDKSDKRELAPAINDAKFITPEPIEIAGVVVRRDADGRYSLNDLHRAAGGEKRHAPNEWLRLKASAELVAELTGDSRFAPVDSVKGGVAPGTYVAKELVYAFAMWISPAFHLKVIRAYDAQVTARGNFIDVNNPRALRALLLDYTEKVEALETKVAEQAPKVEYADALLNADGTTLVRDVAKALGVGPKKLYEALKLKGVILPNNAPAAKYASAGYFKEGTHSYETNSRGTQIGHTPRVTGRGIEFLRRFIARHPDLLRNSSAKA